MTKAVPLYDEEKLERILKVQRAHNWDLESSICWQRGIDLTKPLVGLDKNALFYPKASQEERLVISQMMGLIIASAIYEMEESLIRLRHEAWESIYRKYPISPEFRDLGVQFFEEEKKHSEAFKRYVTKFAETLGVEHRELTALLPVIEKTKSEYFFKKHLEQGGQSFWWIVAIVEQHFLLIYRNLNPFKEQLDPLYFDIHEKHFEEEARHISFPYLMLELLKEQQTGFVHKLFTRYDLAVAQMIQGAWAISSLSRTKEVKKMKAVHPFFHVLAQVQEKHDNQNMLWVLWKLFTQTPYVGALLNPNGHPQILEFAKSRGTLTIPFPEFDPQEISGF